MQTNVVWPGRWLRRAPSVALLALLALLIGTAAQAAEKLPTCPLAVADVAAAVAPERAASAASGAAAADPPAAPVAAGATSPNVVEMPDGQLESANLRVWLPQPLPVPGRIWLCLLTSNTAIDGVAKQLPALELALMAQGSHLVPVADGPAVAQAGTLLMFKSRTDLLPLWKPVMRVRPLLIWASADGSLHQLIGGRDVHIGQAPAAWALTAVGLLLFFGVMVGLTRRGPSMVGMLMGDDGHLSLSKLQMGLWTLAVGMVVLYFAILRLDVPSVPESLVALMGMSLATTGISFHAAAKTAQAVDQAAGQATAQANAQAAARADQAAAATVAQVAAAVPADTDVTLLMVSPPAPPPAVLRAVLRAAAAARVTWLWSDLVAVDEDDGSRMVSLARAQMLFWTGLLLIVFITKTVLHGSLWEMPWSLVALMGISQVGYLAPKFNTTPAA